MSIKAIFDVPAPAKLNLFLHVLGRRDDGYHLLDSLMVPIDWCDTLHVERRNDGALARHDLATVLPADDLSLRAARALQKASGTSLGADISIDKRVPWAAGLGGGSSDAASTLLALNRLWSLDWPLARLLPIGLSLGADVPFFLAGTPARATGIGERLLPAPASPGWFAVVKPAAGLDTGTIFASPQVAKTVEAARIAGFSEAERRLLDEPIRSHARPTETGPELAVGFGRNDLQAAAEALCPDVARAAAGLHARFGNSRMTGSGSAVFAWAGNGSVPSAAMPSDWPSGWSSRMCRSLERHPLADWARRED
jgi:4-diphosphocytidyl-2-C-methyl-D-erythritol kinase